MQSSYEVREVIGPTAASHLTFKKFRMQNIKEEVKEK